MTRSRPADAASGFFSNVNSAVLRECWEAIRFRDVATPRTRRSRATRWRPAGARRTSRTPACCTRTTTRWREFMRRYFDEYRGLRETTGHVERLRPLTRRRAGTRRTSRHMRASGLSGPQTLAWAGRSLRHHAGRAVFASLGSRADRLQPAPRDAACRSRNATQAPAAAPATAGRRSPTRGCDPHFTEAAAPLAAPSPHDETARSLHFAWMMPPFRRGSGGHMTLFTIARELERAGHSCSIWIHDPEVRMHDRAAVAHRELIEHFAPLRGGVFSGFEDWHGADVDVRHRLADRLPAVDAAGLQAEGIPRAGLRARFLLCVGRAPVGGGDLSHGLRLRGREPVAG